VIEVFGHDDVERLPDTEADPPDPGWVKVDAMMDEYHARMKREDKEYEKALWASARAIKGFTS
jgi:hypothetical protein